MYSRMYPKHCKVNTGHLGTRIPSYPIYPWHSRLIYIKLTAFLTDPSVDHAKRLCRYHSVVA